MREGALPQEDLQTRRGWILRGLLLGAFAVCALRLFYLQVLRGRDYAVASEQNRTQVILERAPRGRILDRNGIVLADNAPAFVALFSPLHFPRERLPEVARKLEEILAVPAGEVRSRMENALRSRRLTRLADRMSRRQAFALMEAQLDFPGVSLTVEFERAYPRGVSAAHVLGYVGEINTAELASFGAEGYRMGDRIGKMGVERVYDPVLHGQDGGWVVEVDAQGRQKRMIRHVPPIAGKDLVLTLDERLQQEAEDRLRKTGRSGAAVMSNPRSGEILVLASWPSFDPGAFLPLTDSQQRQQILSDPRLPLFNRTIQALYPLGSVFKIVTSAALLESHAMSVEEAITCRGFYELGRGRRVFKCWKPRGHGRVSFLRGFAESCDVYFYQAGLRARPEQLEDFGKRMGLGALTGIDIPSEKAGLIPGPHWKMSQGGHWYDGETLNLAIGQGALLATPIQALDVASLVATRGILWQPYLVEKAVRAGEPEDPFGTPRVAHRLALSEGTWEWLHKGMKEVVESGTGQAARIPGILVSGKTGTAQNPHGKDHAWFVAYAPSDEPRVACAVFVENAGHGGSVAAPIAGTLIAKALGVSSSPPLRGPHRGQTPTSGSNPSAVRGEGEEVFGD